MKYMIASDLHGSYRYGELLFRRFDEEKPLKLLLLGDLLYHGARNDLPEEYSTKRLTALLNEYADSIIAVRGNCDSEIDDLVLDFPTRADYSLLYADGREWILTHGHLFDEHSMIPHGKGAVLLHGHTHVKAFEEHIDFTYVNPGSVSIPKDGTVHSYAVYEDGVFSFRDVTDGKTLFSRSLS